MKNIIEKLFTYFRNETENECCGEIESCPCGLEKKLLFRKDNVFISPDRDGYRGGMWKKFNGDGRRIGTWNRDLTELIGD